MEFADEVAVPAVDINGLAYAIWPGRCPEPARLQEPIPMHDPKSAIDRCLSCPMKHCQGTCEPDETPKKQKKENWCERRERNQEIDAKVEAMTAIGYGNYPICRELGITEQELKQARVRIRRKRKKEVQV